MSKQRAAAISNAMVSKASGTTGLAIPPTGPHALFNQPGISIRSARRRRRLKAFNWGAHVGDVISGGLKRGAGGRFSGSGQASSRGSTEAQRKRAEERKAVRQARADERAAAREQELADEEATRAEEDAYIAAGKTGRERQKRRAEIAAKRRQRVAARRDKHHQEDAAERETRRQEDEQESKTREQEAQENLGKGGGSGGGKAKPTDEEKRQEQDRKKVEARKATAPKAGLKPDEAEFLAGAASGTLPPDSFDASNLRAMGLVVDTGDTTEVTDEGRRALAALERGDVRAALAAIQDGKARLARDEAKRARDQERIPRKTLPSKGGQKPDPRRSPGQTVPGQRPAPRLPVSTMPVRPAPQPDPAIARERSRALAQQAIRNLEERRRRRSNRGIGGITNVERRNAASRRTKGFAVFKDASGADRWASITTTAYQDKDQEWISRKAIQAVVAAGDAGTPRGPLRFWHVPGLDLGDCDYQAALGDGRMLLESGTFRSKAAARIGQAAATRGYQMSPGFVHTHKEPRAGVYDHIALFERSFVPPGRASNPYTRLLTKEIRMLTDEKRKEFEALAGDDEGRALLTQLLAQAETTTKAADRAGAVYKDAPEWAQDLARRLDALEVTIKAPMSPESMMEAGDTETDDGMAEMDAETDPDAAGDLMDDEGFADLIVQKLMAAIGPMLELEKKVAGYLDNMKGMLQPVAAKDDARAKEIAELKAVAEAGARAGAALAERLKALEGEQPRAARSLHAGIWGDLTGITVTKEQADALTAQPPGTAPAGLNDPAEIGAYKLIFGNE